MKATSGEVKSYGSRGISSFPLLSQYSGRTPQRNNDERSEHDHELQGLCKRAARQLMLPIGSIV